MSTHTDTSDPRRWLLENTRTILLDEESIISLHEGPTDASLCAAYLQVLDAIDHHAPIQLFVHSGAQVSSWLLSLCLTMKKLIRAPIYTLGHTAVGGSLLVVAAGAKGRRFVLDGERYEVNLAALAESSDENGQEADAFDGHGNSPVYSDGDEEPAQQKFADRAGAIESNNARFLKLLKCYCGERALPLIQKLVEGNTIRLSARDAVRYGFADHVLTRRNRNDFFVNTLGKEKGQ